MRVLFKQNTRDELRHRNSNEIQTVPELRVWKKILQLWKMVKMTEDFEKMHRKRVSVLSVEII